MDTATTTLALQAALTTGPDTRLDEATRAYLDAELADLLSAERGAKLLQAHTDAEIRDILTAARHYRTAGAR